MKRSKRAERRRFKGWALLVAAGGLVGTGLAACEESTGAPAGPAATEDATLLVYVVVDQLRGDLIERYDTVFTGGIARLKAEGFRFTAATFDHAMTATSPGHATAATGVHPYRHGLVGNNWEEQDGDGNWNSVYALRQLSAPILGFPDMEGRGPENLDRSGIADWILDANPEARIVSLSGKDRAAIAMGGRSRGEVYWFESQEGRWVTSSFYRDHDPDWIERFHAEGMARTWTDTIWESTVPGWAEPLSRPDTFPHEGDGVNTYFPHVASREVGRDERALHAWRARGPFLDANNLELARHAVRELRLGSGEHGLDYLALPLSQMDRVGHDYGPLSREQLDNLIRLDRELGAFLDFLDEEVGEGRWLLGFTADHGVLELPEVRPEMGLPGVRLGNAELREMIRAAEAAHAGAEENGAGAVDRARAAAEAALEFEFVEDAFAFEDILHAESHADTFRILFARSYRPERAIRHLGHLQVGVRLGEGIYPSGSSTGTGHGSPYHYDRHVPFIVMGPGVVPGVSAEPVSVVDLAPTLAALLGVPAPSDLDGRIVLPAPLSP